jgi:hypothetical protein
LAVYWIARRTVLSDQSFEIEFQDASRREANLNAESLKVAILNSSEGVRVEQKRDDEHSQDFGATLLVVLGTPAVIAFARALGDWLKLHHSVVIDIKTPDGRYLAKNITAKDAQELAERFRSKL